MGFFPRCNISPESTPAECYINANGILLCCGAFLRRGGASHISPLIVEDSLFPVIRFSGVSSYHSPFEKDSGEFYWKKAPLWLDTLNALSLNYLKRHNSLSPPSPFVGVWVRTHTRRVYMCARTCSQVWHQSPGRDCQPNDFHLHWWQMAVAWTSTDWKQMKRGPSSPALHLITQHMLEITPKRIWGTLVDLQHEKSSFSSVSFCLIQFAQIIDVVGGRARRRARLICSA